jgi:hypothetical protein
VGRPRCGFLARPNGRYVWRVANPLTALLFGRGDVSDSRRVALEAEGVVHLEQGLKGSITYRHYRAPGRRSNWRKQAIRAALVLTRRRLAVFVRTRPIVDVAFDDARISGLEVRAERGALLIDLDASTFNAQASGQITIRLRCAAPAAAVAEIHASRA